MVGITPMRSSPCQRQALGARHVGQFLGLAQHAAGLFGDLAPKRREADDAAGALDEGDADQCLELAQAGRQRRLGDEAGFRPPCRNGHVAERDEILQLLDGRQVDGHRKFDQLRDIMNCDDQR